MLAVAPLAALWGPNPVPRAGGRCLDVVRLLRITTDSPAVEATSTRCQAVLEAFRGRASAARRMIDAARRTVSELGLRHARLEVEQFAGIVELVVDDPAAAEPHLRKAYNGFRRMGLDADTAETAALLGRACLALDRDAEADELCSESERLAGHALKASIAWRTLRAQLMSRRGDHNAAREVAEAAIALAERTDALVDHGDACLALAAVLSAAGDTAIARAAASRAAALYQQKGAAALVERARRTLAIDGCPATAEQAAERPASTKANQCTQVGERLVDAVNREAWAETQQLLAPEVSVESRRKIVGFPKIKMPASQWSLEMRRYLQAGMVHVRHEFIAVRGERLALVRLVAGTADQSPGAPHDEMLQLYRIDDEGQISQQIWFDLADINAAVAELDAAHALLEEATRAPRLENAASRMYERFKAFYASRDLGALGEIIAEDVCTDDRRRVVNAGAQKGRKAVMAEVSSFIEIGALAMSFDVIATRGEHLIVNRSRIQVSDERHAPIDSEIIEVIEVDADEHLARRVVFDADDIHSAFDELETRYLAGEAAVHANTWSVITQAYAALNSRRLPALAPDWVDVDHRSLAAIDSGDLVAYIRAAQDDLAPGYGILVEAVHRLNSLGAVVSHTAQGISREGVAAEWRMICIFTVTGGFLSRAEIFDETDLDAALARFEELHPRNCRLENAASRMLARFLPHFATREWDVMAAMLTEDLCLDDRRRVVNAGVVWGRDMEIANLRAIADAGVAEMKSTPVATRGERLVLHRLSFYVPDWPEEQNHEMLEVVEITADGLASIHIEFDLDDFDMAVAELDARYMAGDGAAHAPTWAVAMRAQAALDHRRELPPTTPSWISLDHRRGIGFAPGDMTPYVRAGWYSEHVVSAYIEVVYRLNDLGTLFVNIIKASSTDGFDAEWRMIELMTVDGDLISRAELFDEADLDIALAKFDQLCQPASRLENETTRVIERFQECFAARDWDAVAEIMAADISAEDHRRVMRAGTRPGREVNIADWRSVAEVGFSKISSKVIAIRGERLALGRFLISTADDGPEPFYNDFLGICEIDSDGRIAASTMFDPDDVDAAFEELDARYIAGEAAPHAPTWSLVTRAFSMLNRREIPPTTAAFQSIDHRSAAAYSPGDLEAYVHAGWQLDQNIKTHIEAVHRLNSHGAVVTHAAHGASWDGFEAEWRGIDVLSVEGELIGRSELFDEGDLNAALQRFDEISRSRLENAATRVADRYASSFKSRDWAAMAGLITEDFSIEDRRPTVNAGIRRGRDAGIKEQRAVADVGFTDVARTVLAIRGEHLALLRAHYTGSDEGTEPFEITVLHIVEIAMAQVTAVVTFDCDALDAALQELDARYVAGGEASKAHVYSVIAGAYSALNRREIPLSTPDWVNFDHRRGATVAPGNLVEFVRAAWELEEELYNYIETVHRLTGAGAAVTRVTVGTSGDGFDAAEWRTVDLMIVDGDLVSRFEMFEEDDLETALDRFDELAELKLPLDNAATRVGAQLAEAYNRRDQDAYLSLVTQDGLFIDRRQGLHSESEAALRRNFQAVLDVSPSSFEMTWEPIATRGNRLSLAHEVWTDSGQDGHPVAVELLTVMEVSDAGLLHVGVAFDLDDIDAAFTELDSRYLAGEAGAFTHTWSVVAGTYASLNSRQMPAKTPDCVMVDRRSSMTYDGDVAQFLDATWEMAPDITFRIEAVHRITDLGALVTFKSCGTSEKGFTAEWRAFNILTIEGDLISRGEVFDEDDLDAALARFDELAEQKPRLENAASKILGRCAVCFAARDWDALGDLFAVDYYNDDRRRVVNAGIRSGRAAAVEDLRVAAEVGLITNITTEFIATRGKGLILNRFRASGGDHPAVQLDVYQVVECGDDERIAAVVVFDIDDIDVAFAELEARYLAGEAAGNKVWSEVSQSYAAMNQHEIPPTMSNWATIDHRVRETFEGGELSAHTRSAWDLLPDVTVRIETVHRLTNIGAVATQVAYGTSQDGFEAEWRMLVILVRQTEGPNRCELFDEADLDAAMARFDELGRPAPNDPGRGQILDS